MEIRVSKHVNAPLDRVFEVFSDIQNAEERIEGITNIDILSDKKQGVGTRWRETRIMFGREATEEMEISRFEEPKVYEVVASSNGIDYFSRYTFTEQNGGTLVNMTFSGKPKTFMAKLMTPLGYLFQGSTKKAMEGDMDDLKRYCEKRGV